MQKKSFDKIQCSFIIKTLQKVSIKETNFKIIKVIYHKPTVIILIGEKLEAFLLRSGTKQGCTSTTFIPLSFGNPSHHNRRRKRNKRDPDWKRRHKTVIVYR